MLDYPDSLVPLVVWGTPVATHEVNGTHVTGLSDAGKVVGWANLSLGGPELTAPSYHQPFVYDIASKTWSNFQFDPHASVTAASGDVGGKVTPEGITNAGDIYGEYTTSSRWQAFYQFAATGAVAMFDHPDGSYTSLVAGHADRVVLGNYTATSGSAVNQFMARITAR